MSPSETAAQVRVLAEAGVDFIKDDELQSDGPHCPFTQRASAVLQLRLFALTWAAGLQPGAPLCRAHAVDASSAPLELVLKGGQIGSEDFFAVARGR
jgi:hypothetical protein